MIHILNVSMSVTERGPGTVPDILVVPNVSLFFLAPAAVFVLPVIFCEYSSLESPLSAFNVLTQYKLLYFCFYYF